jgi:diguanylate cyclase (GGDEF)-like protein
MTSAVPQESRGRTAPRRRSRAVAWVMRAVLSFDRLPRLALRLVVVALLAGVAAVDLGFELGARGTLLYLLPVSIAAYHTTTRFGIVTAVASAVVGGWIESDLAKSAPFWPILNHFGLFLFVATLLVALRRAYEEEKALARSDPLTGVANLRRFREAAAAELARARRFAHPVTLVLLDVDDFKQVNDNRGHDAGDALLREVAATLRRVTRVIDVVARIGGDEFAVLLPETGPDGARVAAEKLRLELDRTVRDQDWPVSFSVGAVTSLDPGRTLDDLVRRADELAYDVKRSGKGGVRCTVLKARPPAMEPSRSSAGTS